MQPMAPTTKPRSLLRVLLLSLFIAVPNAARADRAPVPEETLRLHQVPTNEADALALVVREATSTEPLSAHDMSALAHQIIPLISVNESNARALSRVSGAWVVRTDGHYSNLRNDLLVALAERLAPLGLAAISSVCGAVTENHCDVVLAQNGDLTARARLADALRNADSGSGWYYSAENIQKLGNAAPLHELADLLASRTVYEFQGSHRMMASGECIESGRRRSRAADLFVVLAVETWALPVQFAVTPQTRFTKRQIAEVRRLIAAHP